MAIYISLLVLCAVALAGIITPKTARPILPSYNNMNVQADYSIFYNIETFWPEGTYLEITFPNDYADNLGIGTTCQAEDGSGNAYSSCTVALKVVTILIGEMTNLPETNTKTVVIKGIVNPSISQGQGQFKIRTYSGINTWDYNDMFGVIGIYTDAPQMVTTSVACTLGCVAGDPNATYTMTFTNVAEIVVDSRIRYFWPSTNLTFPTTIACTSTVIGASISCVNEGDNTIMVTGIMAAIPAQTSVDIQFTGIQNMKKSGAVGNVGVEVLEGPVNNLTNRQLTAGDPQPILTPNSIGSITHCPQEPACAWDFGIPDSSIRPYLTPNNVMVYVFTITTYNDIPADGAVQIIFPTGYTLTEGTCFLRSGFSNLGLTEAEQVYCTISAATRTVTINTFGYFTAGAFVIELQMQNPSSLGSGGNIQVFTYYENAMTNIIDQMLAYYISIEPVAGKIQHQKWEITWNDAATNQPTDLVVGTLVDLDILFRPSVGNPIDDATGQSIRIKVPDVFTWDIQTVGAEITPHWYFPPYDIADATITPVAPEANKICIDGVVSDDWADTGDNRLQVFSLRLPNDPGKFQFEFILGHGCTGADVESISMEVEVLPGTMPITARAITIDVNQLSVYEFTFTPQIDVPQASVPEFPQIAWGTVDIFFPTQNTDLQNLWPTDLGTGLNDGDTVPCRAVTNIQLVSGDNILCRLFKAAAVSPTDYSYVRITNFLYLYSSNPFTVHIAGIANPITDSVPIDIEVATYSIESRYYQMLNKVTYTMPDQAYDDGTLSLPITNGRSPAPLGDDLFVITLTPNEVSKTSELSCMIWPEIQINIQGAIIFKFPTDYELPMNGITCYINHVYSIPCYTYPDANWILLDSITVVLTAHVEYNVTIQNLVNPKHIISPQSVQVIFVDSNHHETEYLESQLLAQLEPGPITPVTVFADSRASNDIDVTYTWIFTLTNTIEANGSIVLTFPKDIYNLETSPSPACEISKGLSDLDASNPIQCSFASNVVTITSFAAYTSGEIMVKILHVLNPSEIVFAEKFKIESLSTANKVQDANYELPGIQILSELPICQIEHKLFEANPSNGYSKADYTISVRPVRRVPAETVIIIDFPVAEFPSLPATPNCRLSNGLTTLKSCTSDGQHRITIETDADYEYNALSQAIDIWIEDIDNFVPGLTSGVVLVEMSYSGVTFCESPSSEDNRKFTTDMEPNILFGESYSVSPQTGGEQAYYSFNFRPETSFISTCTVNIEFPAQYPRRLAETGNIECYSTELSSDDDGVIDCFVSERVVTIANTIGWTATETTSFTITIHRVMNPPYGSVLSTFKTYTQCGLRLMDYKEQAFSFSLSGYPAIMWITEENAQNNYVGNTSNQVLLKTKSSSQMLNGVGNQVFVDFPADYDLKFAGAGILANVFWNSANYESVSYRDNRVSVSDLFDATSAASSDVLEIQVELIENPLLTGEARYISLAFFNLDGNIIQTRSYSNLNYVTPYTIISSGDDIIVNEYNPWTMNVGTQTQPLICSIPTKADVDLYIETTSMPENCVLVPTQIPFAAGQTESTFAMRCEQDAKLGDYPLDWKYTFSSGTTIAAYNPVRRSIVTIVDNQDETITIDEIGIIPLGGTSIPINIVLSNPVYFSISVAIQKIGDLPTAIQIDPAFILFSEGEYTKEFTVTIEEDAQGIIGELLFTLDGINKNSYNLDDRVKTFAVGPKDVSPPVALDYQVIEIYRTVAGFRLRIDEKTSVYWCLGLRGIPQPTVDEVKAQSYTNSTAQDLYQEPLWGKFINTTEIQTADYEYIYYYHALSAQTQYTIHFIIIDYGNNEAQVHPSVNFETTQRHRQASFSLYFQQSSSATSPEFIARVIAFIEQLLYLKTGQVVQRWEDNGLDAQTTTSNNTVAANTGSSAGFDPPELGRRLQDIQQVDFVMLPDPSLFPGTTPLEWVDQLQDLQGTLFNNFPTLDTNQAISGILNYGNLPQLKLTPVIGSTIGGRLLLLDLALVELGWGFVCVMAVEDDTVPTTPTSWHITQGINYNTYPCTLTGKTALDSAARSLEIEGLGTAQNYWVYISATNLLQVYPDLLPDSNVVALSFKTLDSFSDVEDWAIKLSIVILISIFF